jgi:hypothetical protein
MLSGKPIILSIIAACGLAAGGASTDPPAEQPDKKPPGQVEEGQHFCCQSVDEKTFSGEGCVPISGEAQIAVCNKVLYCNGNWIKNDGKVTCE